MRHLVLVAVVAKSLHRFRGGIEDGVELWRRLALEGRALRSGQAGVMERVDIEEGIRWRVRGFLCVVYLQASSRQDGIQMRGGRGPRPPLGARFLVESVERHLNELVYFLSGMRLPNLGVRYGP